MSIAQKSPLKEDPPPPHTFHGVRAPGNFRIFWRAFTRRWTTYMGLVILLAVFGMALSASFFFPQGPLAMVTRPLLWPGQNLAHPLGSDILGRDILAGIFYGSRISLLIGSVATLVATVFGVLIGSMSGYLGGRVDNLLMRLTELIQTIPPFLFALVIVAILRPSIRTIVVALAATSWPQIARLVRGEFISMRDREFVQACHSVGMGNLRIIFSEILPNALSPVIVTASIMVATAILAESSLAFLGLGDPNVMSWGNLIAAGREMLRTAWYITAIPGVAIILTVLALNLIGDGLNDAMNPHLKNK